MPSPPPIETLKIECEQRGDITVARLIGSANMVSASALQDELFTLLEQNPRHLVLDLSQLAFISSVGLGGIIAAHLRCRKNNSTMAMAAPSADILELLQVTNLTRLFPVHRTVETALAHLGD